MLSRVLGFVGSLKIADPCVSSKPFMRRIAVWTVGLPEKYWARAEGRGLLRQRVDKQGVPAFGDNPNEDIRQQW